MIEPAPSPYEFPDPLDADDDGVVGAGADFAPGTLLKAYRRGIFPWPHQFRGRWANLWFSPDPRTVFWLDKEPHFSRSLRRTLRKHPFRVSFDEAFATVMSQCADLREGEGTWITSKLQFGFAELHRLGWAHSVEVWEGEALVGGLYGIAVGGVFCAESMFHLRTDASKIAFAELVKRLRSCGFSMLDAQVMNPHLASMGCVEVPRTAYLDRLARSLSSDATWATGVDPELGLPSLGERG